MLGVARIRHDLLRDARSPIEQGHSMTSFMGLLGGAPERERVACGIGVGLPCFCGRSGGLAEQGPGYRTGAGVLLVDDGRAVSERRVPAQRIVEAFDVAEAGHPGLGLRTEAAAGEQLAFEGREEALGHRVDAPMSVKWPRPGSGGGVRARRDGRRSRGRRIASDNERSRASSVLERSASRRRLGSVGGCACG